MLKVSDQFELDRIRDGIDIIGFVSRYTKLRRVGSQYIGLCPFHRERTPSFSLHSKKQLWHCHGCQRGGDLFTFVMRAEGLDFHRAKLMLANEAGAPVQTMNAAERRELARLQRDREIAAEWRDGLVEAARDLRNAFHGAYHRALRHILNCTAQGQCCGLAMDAAELYEKRYTALDEKIDVLVSADMNTVVADWRKRTGAAA